MRTFAGSSVNNIFCGNFGAQGVIGDSERLDADGTIKLDNHAGLSFRWQKQNETVDQDPMPDAPRNCCET